MSTAIRINSFKDTMPQIVPSAGFTPPYCDYSAFTTDFDLSLLPASPLSDFPQLSPYLSLYPPSPPLVSDSLEEGIICDNIGFVNVKAKLVDAIKYEVDDEPLHTPLKKSLSAGFFGQTMDHKEKQNEYFVKKEESQPLIPTTIQGSTTYYPVTIKQEPDFGLEFSQAHNPTVTDYSSALYNIKTEKTIDLQEVLKESHYLQVKYQEPNSPDDTEKPAKSDHQLLRSVLKDTSFQRKFNLKTIDISQSFTESEKDSNMDTDQATEGPEMEQLTQDRMDPVFSLAIEQIQKEVESACHALGLSRDPTQWTADNVKSWLMWTVSQYSLPMLQVDAFDMDGLAFSQLTEEEFQERTPLSGSTLHAHLEIWKAAACCGEVISKDWSPPTHSSGSSTGGDLSEDDDEDMDTRASPGTSSQSTPGPSTQSSSDKAAGAKSRGGSGSHIHLWQFLKELLSTPQVHGSCIRWLDRQKGVFKIEDSVRVARLWGKRKNRPAMNYDKLSRSIRQYYKKGIMKKTERSQRLVYQFCHPYSL